MWGECQKVCKENAMQEQSLQVLFIAGNIVVSKGSILVSYHSYAQNPDVKIDVNKYFYI